MKKYKIYSHDRLIGESDLEFNDASMCIYSGRMIPTAGYDGVRHVFKTYCNALDLSDDERGRQLERYYRMRDDLKLTVVTQDGNLLSVNWVHIVDLDDSTDDLELEISSTEPPAD